MRIYTKTGDDGSTGLIGGARVPKDDPRIECYGTVDELNATLGVCAVAADDAIKTMLVPVQNELFVIGSQLAADPSKPDIVARLPRLDESSIHRLERQIDAADQELPKLTHFILPDGTELAARLHLARTICRRAERLLVHEMRNYAVDGAILRYLNRLSDWLFTTARLANHRAGVAEQIWESPSSS